MAIKILLQTTIVPTTDDWSIARFHLLSGFLSGQRDASGKPLFEVTARDRAAATNDPVLSTLHRSDFDEMWLFAVDVGDGLRIGDELVGISTRSGYTVNVGAWSSLAMVDERHAVDGTEVTLVWGEPTGSTRKPTVERHAQTEVRAVLSTTPLA